MRNYFLFLNTILLVVFQSCAQQIEQNENSKRKSAPKDLSNFQTAYFASGCFWCVEAIYETIDGVYEAESGYAGGKTKNPTYEEVCRGNTGHAETVKIYYDSTKVTFKELVRVFFNSHDPTTLNRQGADVGTQYRSEIFYHSLTQKESAEKYIKLLEKEKLYDRPVVTKVSSASQFYLAEDYHQNYYELNKNQPYCAAVISPKLKKLKEKYKDKLKTE
jgi:peptide-methionine (S)-S-oxide reductase